MQCRVNIWLFLTKSRLFLFALGGSDDLFALGGSDDLYREWPRGCYSQVVLLSKACWIFSFRVN